MGKILFEVSKIDWERVFLNFEITTNYTGNVKFYLERFDKLIMDDADRITGVQSFQKILLKPEQEEAGKYSFCCNIAAMDQRQFLDNGRWRIIAVTDTDKYVCYVAHEVAYRYDDYSRIFRYGNGKYAYNISFSSITEDETYLWLVLNSYFMIRNDGWKKRRYVQEVSGIPSKVKRICMSMAIILMKAFYQFFEHVFPKKGNRVLLMSETKDYLWGNLKFIDEGIKRHGLDKQFKVEYSFRKAVGSHMSVLSWVKLIFKLAQQDYVFVDDYVPIFGFLTLNKRTKLIQVWHAGEGFKAVGYCRFGKEGTPYPVGSCHKKYDYVLTGSEKLIKVFAEVFGIEEEAFLPVGMPRLDGFLDEERISEFRKEFYGQHPEMKDKKIILFAPTYRGKGQKTAYYDYSWIDLREIYEVCGSEYIFLVKMHPFVKVPIDIPEEYRDRIIDFASYPNINDLYYITDLLITDYSSNYFEYSLMKKPVLFFTPDREIYELSRGVHRSVKESAPGKVCDTFEEMMDAMRNEDYEVEKIYQFVKNNFANYDGRATDKAIEQILLAKDK